LAPDPAVTAILADLADNSCAILPSLKTVGEWNEVTRSFNMETQGPRGRDYTIKAVWMPERKRAFFCGANHGSPHRLNDAWEFDLPSHTWVLLFAPDPHNAKGVMEIVEGEVRDASGKVLEKVKYVQTKRGGPTHYGHTWWGLAYDPGMRAALWMNVGIGSSATAYVEEQTGSKEGVYRGPPLWAFYPAERRWRRVLTPQPWAAIAYAGAMEYVPDLGGAFWYSSNWSGAGMFLYNGASNVWHNLKPNGGENPYHSKQTPRAEAVMAYDRSRRVVVAQSHDRSTCLYDLKANTWRKVLDPGKDAKDAPRGHDASSLMFYDSVNEVTLLFEVRQPDGIWSYSVAENRWTRHTALGPTLKAPGRVIGYFDEARNVFVVNHGSQTWVYRFRAPTPASHP
jgi:hypothetical protein